MNNKILIYSLICISLTACQNINTQQAAVTDNSNQLLNNHVHIPHSVTSYGHNLYYTYPFSYADLDNKMYTADRLHTTLAYENGCLYLMRGNEKTMPYFPFGTTWDEDNKTLRYHNIIYQIGDTIVSNDGTRSLESEKQYLEKSGSKFVTTPAEKCKTKRLTEIEGLIDGIPNGIPNRFYNTPNPNNVYTPPDIN